MTKYDYYINKIHSIGAERITGVISVIQVRDDGALDHSDCSDNG
jgi:hypothetical protein